MKEVINIINQLRNESSTNGNIKILKDNKDNELLKKVLEYTYNPFKKYGVTEKVLIPTNEESNNIELFQLLDLLSNSNINDSLRKTVNSFLGSIQFKEERDLYVCMLLKDLKIGCNSKTINKVWKNLIPSFNVMLADKYFEKQQKVKGKEFIITQKLDGSRFVLIKDNLGNVKCYTRQGQEVNGLIEFENDFKLIPNNTVIDELILNDEAILLATSIPALPLTTPHTSPITSLHIEASLSEFFKSITECLLPFTFFDAIEWNGVSLAAVIATPIISNIIPIPIKIIIIRIPKTIFILGITDSDKLENINDNIKDVIITVNIHFVLFFFFFLFFFIFPHIF